jgi:hypothetical protein
MPFVNLTLGEIGSYLFCKVKSLDCPIQSWAT